MATKPSPFSKIRIHTDPNECKDFFKNLKYIHNSQGTELATLPTRDELSWVVQKCPDSIDGLADVLGLRMDEHFESSMGRIGLRQLLVPAYDWIEPTQLATTPTTSPSAIISAIATPTISTIDTPTITPTTLITTTTTSIVSPTTSSTILPSASEAPYTPAEVGVGIGIVLGIVLVPATIVALVVYVKKGVNKREAERVARLRRAVNPEEARRAEEYVRNAWAEGDRRRKEKEEAFELQEVRGQSYGTAESVVEPEPAYRHPRMDWK